MSQMAFNSMTMTIVFIKCFNSFVSSKSNKCIFIVFMILFEIKKKLPFSWKTFIPLESISLNCTYFFPSISPILLFNFLYFLYSSAYGCVIYYSGFSSPSLNTYSGKPQIYHHWVNYYFSYFINISSKI